MPGPPPGAAAVAGFLGAMVGAGAGAGAGAVAAGAAGAGAAGAGAAAAGAAAAAAPLLAPAAALAVAALSMPPWPLQAPRPPWGEVVPSLQVTGAAASAAVAAAGSAASAAPSSRAESSKPGCFELISRSLLADDRSLVVQEALCHTGQDAAQVAPLRHLAVGRHVIDELRQERRQVAFDLRLRKAGGLGDFRRAFRAQGALDLRG